MTPQQATLDTIATLNLPLAWYDTGPTLLLTDAGARCPARPYVVVDPPTTDTDTGAKNWPARTVDLAVRVYSDIGQDPDADAMAGQIRDYLHRRTVSFDGMAGLANVSGPSVSPSDASMVGRILRIRIQAFATVAT